MRSKAWRMRWLGVFALPAAFLGPLLPSTAAAQGSPASPASSARPTNPAPERLPAGDGAKKPQVRTYSSVTVVDDPKQVPPLPTGHRADAVAPGADVKAGVKPPPGGRGAEPPTPPSSQKTPAPAEDRPGVERSDRASQREQLRQELRELRQELREQHRDRDRDRDNRAAGPRSSPLKNAESVPRLERLRERLRPNRD